MAAVSFPPEGFVVWFSHPNETKVSNMKRTPIALRSLPNYTKGEEWLNAMSHAVGAGFGIAALILCILKAARGGDPCAVTASVIYGFSMIAVFGVSSVYHGMKTGFAKKVMQVVDHCTIYLLIAGSYTVIVLSAIRPRYPALGWGLFVFEWALAALAAGLTAIDLKKYSVFSMICYIGMGWAVIPFWRPVLEVLTLPGFLLLLFGGIAYSIGAILYGLGKKRKWMHGIFHLFVVLGALLQFFSVLFYAL